MGQAIVRNPGNGQQLRIRWDEKNGPPSAEHIAALFGNTNATRGSDNQPDPSQSSIPDATAIAAPKRLPAKSFELPDVESVAPRPTDAEIQKNVAAMSPAEHAKLLGGLPSFGAADVTNDELEARRRALEPRPGNAGIEGLLAPLSGIEHGIEKAPGAIKAGAEQFGKGFLQAMAPLYPALAMYSARDEQGQPLVEGRPLTGLLNMGTGLAKGIGAAGMALTPMGWGINAATETANLSPEVGKFMEGLMAPAEVMRFGQSLGISPENARNVNEMVDAIVQVLGMHGLSKFKSVGGLPTESTLAAPEAPGMFGRALNAVKGSLSRGLQELRERPGLASRVIPADPIGMLKKVKNLRFIAQNIQNPNDAAEVSRAFDTKVLPEGEQAPGIRQYTVQDPSTPGHGVTFYVNEAKGETLAGQLIEKNLQFAAGEYGRGLLNPEQPARPSTMTPKATDYYGAEAQIVPGLTARAVRKNPAFKKWFGDSKVVDEKGQPMVLYHGTRNSFSSFDIYNSDLGSHFGAANQARDILSANASNFPERSQTYPVYLSIKNPLRLKDEGSFDSGSRIIGQLEDRGVLSPREASMLASKTKRMVREDATEAIRQAIEAKGYDGIVYLNRREGTSAGPVTREALDAPTDAEFRKLYPSSRDSYIAFHPEQIKSATGNRGTFSPTSDSIVQSRVVPGMNADRLNSFLKRAARGGEIPWAYDPKKGVMVGKLGDKHISAFGKDSSAFDIAGRVTGGGDAVSIWGERGEQNQQALSDVLFDLVRSGKAKKDAIVYWPDGTNMSIKDAISGEGGQANVSWMPGVSKETITKAVKLASNLTLVKGGSTVDPRTGTSVELGPSESFVSIFPERTQQVDKPTVQNIAEFAKANGDLLKMDDHFIGTWKDPETGKIDLDVVVKEKTPSAKKLGSESFQKAVYGREGEAGPEVIATGGTGEVPQGWKHPVPEGERLQRFRESQMSPEEQAKLAEQRRLQRERPVFDQEFGDQANQIEASRAATEYNRSIGLKDLPVTEDIAANAKRIEDVFDPSLGRVRQAWEEFEARTGKKRSPWYGGLNEARKILSKYYPELKNKVQGKLFGYAMNIFANGDSPNNEFMNGLAAWERRQATGKFSPVREGVDDFIGNVRVNTWNAHLEELQNLIDLKGEAGAVKWLETKHPVTELNAVKDQIKSNLEHEGVSNIPSEYGKGQPQEGAYIFGPKMGAYALNKEGIAGPITLDKWMNIAFRIARGIVNTETKKDQLTGEMVTKLSGANTTLERRAAYKAVNSLAQKYGITPEDVQALLWVHVIRPFFETHGQTMKGGIGSHGDFARWLDESGWLNKRVRGEGASLTEGGEITRQRGISEGAEQIPESLRRRGPKGDAAEDQNGNTDFPFGPNK